MANLQPTEILALSKVSPGNARKEVKPGTHAIDCTVRVVGTLRVGEDETYTPTADLPWKAIAVQALRLAGFQRENIATALVEIGRKSLSGDACDFPTDEIAETAKDLLNEALGELPRKSRAGKVFAALQVLPVVAAETEEVRKAS